MTSQKFITSISTIPNQSKLYSTMNLSHYSSTDLKFPYKETLPLKFPKNKIRKQTQLNTLLETTQNPQRSSIRNFHHANRSRIFDQPNPARRLANQGLFHSLSRQSNQYLPLNRSLQDLGAANNRKRFVEARHIRPNPIIVGHPHTQHNSAYEKVWKEPRRHRDNGKHCQQTLLWKTDKNKSYLQRYRDKQMYNNSKVLREKLSKIY